MKNEDTGLFRSERKELESKMEDYKPSLSWRVFGQAGRKKKRARSASEAYKIKGGRREGGEDEISIR